MAALVGPSASSSLTAAFSEFCLTEFFSSGEALNCSTSNSISFLSGAIPPCCCIESEYEPSVRGLTHLPRTEESSCLLSGAGPRGLVPCRNPPRQFGQRPSSSGQPHSSQGSGS